MEHGEAAIPNSTAPATGAAVDAHEFVPNRRASVLNQLLRDPGALAGIIVIVIFVTLAILAPLVSPHNPNFVFDDGTDNNGNPLGHTAKFLLGTDPGGRDVLSRLLWGGRTSLAIAGVAMVMTAVVGVAAGCLAGYLRGWVDVLLMRGTDVLLSFPPVLLAMALAAAFGNGIQSVVVVVAAVAWPPLARTVYAQVLTIREREFVEAARALGAGNLRILRHHIAPQVLPVVLVYTTLGVATAVSLESTLSFLGLGIPSTDNSWGVMINIALDYYRSDPPLLFYPAAAIIITVLAFTLVGEGLRRATSARD
ncbi:MAG: binding-protein-dependent transport system inner rane component [Chloroflexi bacterium]|nr:binding-protein-dependent transport system inner rane component [Chloroflexota bacterium]